MSWWTRHLWIFHLIFCSLFICEFSSSHSLLFWFSYFLSCPYKTAQFTDITFEHVAVLKLIYALLHILHNQCNSKRTRSKLLNHHSRLFVFERLSVIAREQSTTHSIYHIDFWSEHSHHIVGLISGWMCWWIGGLWFSMEIIVISWFSRRWAKLINSHRNNLSTKISAS